VNIQSKKICTSYQGSWSLHKKASPSHPYWKAAYLERAICLKQFGQIEKAENIFLSLKDYTLAYANLGVIYGKNHKYKKAYQYFKIAYEKGCKDADLNMMVFKLLDNPKEGLNELLNPKSKDFYGKNYCIGTAYFFYEWFG